MPVQLLLVCAALTLSVSGIPFARRYIVCVGYTVFAAVICPRWVYRIMCNSSAVDFDRALFCLAERADLESGFAGVLISAV